MIRHQPADARRPLDALSEVRRLTRVSAAVLSISALLLIAAGGLKVFAPAPASDALGVAGLPSHPMIVRVGAVSEVLLGIASLVWATVVIDLLVALSFAAFALFVERLRRQPNAQSCGCFGGEGEIPSGRHVIGNLVLAVGCTVAAVTRPPSMLALVERQPGLGVVFVLASATAAWLANLVLSGRPRTVDS